MPRRRAERRGLRLWPVGAVLALAFATAILVAAAVFYTGWDLLGVRGLKPEHRIDSKTLFDLVKLSFGVVAGAGALVALVVAYRRQRVDEDGALREATRLHTERFTTAVSQLGDASAAVRLGGVHALAGLADDAPTRDLRQTCIDVLCAYLRLPYTSKTDLPVRDAEARHAYLALREVRHTVIRLIRDHLRLEPEHPRSWRDHDFDFTEATFDGGDFSEAVFSGRVSFRGATFSAGTVNFSNARFSGWVEFNGAIFSGSTVDFNIATFSCYADFIMAEFASGTVDFSGAEFSGSGRIRFNMATFSGSTVDFSVAKFWQRGDDARVDFSEATFSNGTVHFREARFSASTVHFSRARFYGGTVSFGAAEFSGSGRVDFSEATFSDGTVDFNMARFYGGTVDFTQATGPAPAGLIPPAGSPLPTGLNLPSTWYPAGS
ncbi:pentapeptide repeat-containing protein [Streptomyces lunaelactis]|uniref:pentapeptide repeat-containing protein n=1 Tax=Streptomyces lunaelactis TaxID=1535768 RepID=UPI00158542EA|nr:pentapeptide repeat-containing protein [Streptomyces lunaelactis]NUK50127.1 pentapeptide repeat-containing protein [Streptomyces lunaelactis]